MSKQEDDYCPPRYLWRDFYCRHSSMQCFYRAQNQIVCYNQSCRPQAGSTAASPIFPILYAGSQLCCGLRPSIRTPQDTNIALPLFSPQLHPMSRFPQHQTACRQLRVSYSSALPCPSACMRSFVRSEAACRKGFYVLQTSVHVKEPIMTLIVQE